MKELAADLGDAPTAADLQAASAYPSLNRFIETFGSWNAAKRTAGLETFRKEGTRDPYSDRELLDLLRKLDRQTDGPVTMHAMQEAEGYPSAVTYQRRFGSWNKAKEAAGLETISENDTRPVYSDEELLDFLQSLAANVGRPLTKRDVDQREDCPDHTTFERRFGSWNNAKEAAGLETIGRGKSGRTPSYSDAELLRLLRQRASEVDGDITKTDMDDADGYPSSSTYTRRFGTWQAAKERAGVND